MFYSHEVLTSRKYGVATVWLVATLGSKSSLKKVSRKAILDVDVQKACDTIVAPAAPMALRLQSNLLYGVTRVYSQQCGYMLHDVDAAKNSMQLLLNSMRASTLDTNGENRGRSEQLVLQDDPEFLPDFNFLNQDLNRMDSALGLLEDTQHSILSPYHSQHTSVRVGSIDEIGNLVIPPSVSSFGGVGGPTGFSSRGGSSAGLRTNIGGLDDDLGLVIDEDGNILMPEDLDHRTPSRTQRQRRSDLRSGSSRGGEQGGDVLASDGHIAPLDDDGYFQLQDDGYVAAPDADLPQANEEGRMQGLPEEPHHETSEETAEAPLRPQARRAHKLVPLDNAMELHNNDLSRWNNNYINTMHDLNHQKGAKEAAAQAKKNAAIWMLGEGDRGPLSMFSGIELLEALTGMDWSGEKAKKRPYEAVEEVAEDRRVRSRSEAPPQEAGRGHLEDDYMPIVEDDTIEQGREVPTPLDDRPGSSIMPWNQSADSRRATALFSAGGLPTSNSLGGGSQLFGRVPLQRHSRLTSASPLLGRGGAPSADLNDFQLPHSQDDDDIYMPDITGDDFELFGAAAAVDTQTAEQSQWQRAALDGESMHFLEFVQTGIEELDRVGDQDADNVADEEKGALSIDFATLLPPAMHSRIVAAQGLLHVLALGTKGLLAVRQNEAFGAITLQVREVVA